MHSLTGLHSSTVKPNQLFINLLQPFSSETLIRKEFMIQLQSLASPRDLWPTVCISPDHRGIITMSTFEIFITLYITEAALWSHNTLENSL